jgi:hypothetical protein
MSVNPWALLVSVISYFLTAILGLTSLPAMEWLARRWYRLTTWGTPAEERERKLAEAESLLYDVLNDPQHLIRNRQGQLVALALGWRVFGGMWDDLAWWWEHAGIPARARRRLLPSDRVDREMLLNHLSDGLMLVLVASGPWILFPDMLLIWKLAITLLSCINAVAFFKFRWSKKARDRERAYLRMIEELRNRQAE